MEHPPTLQPAELELAKRERYFRALTEFGSDVVVVLTREGRVDYVSASVKHMLGYEPGALLNSNVFELLHLEDQLLARDTLERIRAEPHAVAKIEVRVRHQDGTWRVLEVAGQNLLDDPTVSGLAL